MIAIVHLERLIRTGPTGIWSVTDVEVRVDEGGKVGPAGSSAGIVFVLEPEYRTGETVEVKIRNVGTTTYLYQSFYQACFLTYIDASGREFIIPPGTHCDILSEADIAPGETKTLFIWKLDECTKDAWGCQESATLPPGEYTIRGSFVPKGGGIPAMAEITFMIQR